MTTENTAAENTAETCPAEPFGGLLSADATLPAEIGNGCPRCGGELILSRAYRGYEVWPITTIRVDGDASGTFAAVTLGMHALSDEYDGVIAENVECRNRGTGCTFRVSADALSLDIL